MTKRFAGFITVMALTAGVSAAPSVAGRWNLSVASQHGELSMGLVLKQDGKKVTGALGNPHGGRTFLWRGNSPTARSRSPPGRMPAPTCRRWTSAGS